MSGFEEFEGQDYISQTQLYDQQEDEVDLAKQSTHTVQKKTPLGIINKSIQKQTKPVTTAPALKKNPVPPQFLKRTLQNNLKQQSSVARPAVKSIRQPSTKNKNKRQWLSTFKVTQITSLVELKQSQSATKRFKISFSYHDSSTKKSHNATLRFGKRSAHYVIDGNLDHNQALLKQAQIRKAADPFQPNYWCLWLLNNPQCSSLQDSLQYFRKQNNIY